MSAIGAVRSIERRAALGDDAFDQAWREGGAFELEEAVRYALN